MPYTVEVQKRAEKFLRSLKDAALYRRLRTAIDSLASDPRGTGSVKLAGSHDIFRQRVGDYRILYQVSDDILLVLVIEIGHRREVYR